MSRIATHSKIVQFHREIATAHKSINGFYRFNWSEITGRLRDGIQTPAMLLESHSVDLSENQNKTTTFANRQVSFLLLDFAGASDNYQMQEDVLDQTENIALDIAAYLKKLNNDSTSWLYGKIDLSTLQIEPITGIFDNMFGWNVKYVVKNHEPMCYESANWNFM